MKRGRFLRLAFPGLIALMSVFLLSACADGQKETAALSGEAPLPFIGAAEIDPEAAEAALRSQAGSKALVTLPDETEEASSPQLTAPDTTFVPAVTPSEAPAPQTHEETPAASAPGPTETVAPPEPDTSSVPPETEKTVPPAPPSGTPEAADGIRVWMGDSRFVGYSKDASYDAERDVFISGWGMGYEWMCGTAFPEFDKLATEKNIKICYWSLGANDITNDPSDSNLELAAKYAARVGELMARHPEVTFYLLSYGPVGEEGMDPNNIPDCASYNKALRIFTDYLKDHTDMRYLDQGEYIERTGFRVYDGCHYDPETNRRAFAYVLAQSGQ